ncbi:MAG: ATP-dependent Clp protease adaptor ClpS [Planctomycetes bacterium]|jgi:ATP-dependent Clp protease adaptor protein ClpS|nr:ATP-dependent Clp protease adaptor ClpS [Planctomycetota bacterium]
MPSTAPLPTRIRETEGDAKSKLAPLWKVLFHNDDKTSMEFVVRVLMQFFGRDLEQAMEIMLNVHKTGMGIAGVYPREVAELKQEQTTSAARTQKFPLVVTIEPVEK